MFKKFDKQSSTLLKSSQSRQFKQKLNLQIPKLEFESKKVILTKLGIDLQIYNFLIIEFESLFIPTLILLFRNLEILPKIVVDQGAIKFILKGADIMAPGILNASRDFTKGIQVAIFAQGKTLPLAVGITNVNFDSLYNDEGELKPKKDRSGIAILNVHYINDALYKSLIKDL